MVTLTCPHCGQRFTANRDSPAMPFCSPRCKQIDLGGWLEEKHGLPLVREEAEENVEEGHSDGE